MLILALALSALSLTCATAWLARSTSQSEDPLGVALRCRPTAPGVAAVALYVAALAEAHPSARPDPALVTIRSGWRAALCDVRVVPSGRAAWDAPIPQRRWGRVRVEVIVGEYRASTRFRPAPLLRGPFAWRRLPAKPHPVPGGWLRRAVARTRVV